MSAHARGREANRAQAACQPTHHTAHKRPVKRISAGGRVAVAARIAKPCRIRPEKGLDIPTGVLNTGIHAEK